MSAPLEASDLLARIKNGDQQAATDLFERFASRLVNLARHEIDLELRRKIDPEDVMQSAFRSFFQRYGTGEIDVQSWESLWSLLAVITVHKCRHKIRYCRAEKRDVGRERSALRYTEASHSAWVAVSKDPTASHAAMLKEEHQLLMRSLESSERRMLRLHLRGETIEEISIQVARSERTVRRVLRRIRDQLEARCESANRN